MHRHRRCINPIAIVAVSTIIDVSLADTANRSSTIIDVSLADTANRSSIYILSYTLSYSWVGNRLSSCFSLRLFQPAVVSAHGCVVLFFFIPFCLCRCWGCISLP